MYVGYLVGDRGGLKAGTRVLVPRHSQTIHHGAGMGVVKLMGEMAVGL